MHDDQLVGNGVEQVPIVRDQDDGAGIVLQRHRERLPHLEIEVIGRFVEQQQVGSQVRHQRQYQPRFLATGKRRHSFEHPITAKPKGRQKVAQLGFCSPLRPRAAGAPQIFQR